jgi:hypothetical protein
MLRIRYFTLTLAIIFLAVGANAQAQEPSIEVTTEAARAQFSVQGQAQAMHVEIFSPSGELVFESDSANNGQVVQWEMRNDKGERVPDGVYLATITVTDLSGKRRKRIEQISVGSGASSGTQEKQTAAAAAPAAPNAVTPIVGEGTADKLSKFTGPNSIGDSIVTESGNMVGVNITPTATLQANGLQPAPSAANGTAASVLLQTSGGKGGDTTGTNNLAGAGAGISLVAGNGGDAPTGSRRGHGGNITLQPGSTGTGAGATGANGNVLIAPTGIGNVGIGTSTPASRLTVNGGVQIVGSGNGIKFADGSIQIKAASDPASTLTWAGTAGSLTKFTGANSLGTSVVKETGDNVGIGTAAPAQKLHLFGPSSVLRLQSTAANQWSATDYMTDGRSWHTGVGGTTVPNDVKGKFYVFDATAQQFRMAIDTQGNVGIGTTAPQAKLDVAGAIRIPPTTRFKSIHGAAFMPSHNNCCVADYEPTGMRGYYDYEEGWTFADNKYIAPVELPDGAVITELCIDAIDSRNDTNISATLGRTNLPNDGAFNIATLSTGGSSTSVQRPCIGVNSQQVFNSTNVYWISLHLDRSSNIFGFHTLIGARIKYLVTQPLP